MPIQIRPFTPADREFVLALIGRFSEFELPAWRSAEEINRTNRTLLEKAMANPAPDGAIFVAEVEGQGPAGFVHLETQTDYFNGEKQGYISDVAVDSRFEGQGIGRLLLERAEAWSRAQGHRLLTLHVFAANRRAMRLYEKNGFGQEVIKYVKVLDLGGGE